MTLADQAWQMFWRIISVILIGVGLPLTVNSVNRLFLGEWYFGAAGGTVAVFFFAMAMFLFMFASKKDAVWQQPEQAEILTQLNHSQDHNALALFAAFFSIMIFALVPILWAFFVTVGLIALLISMVHSGMAMAFMDQKRPKIGEKVKNGERERHQDEAVELTDDGELVRTRSRLE